MAHQHKAPVSGFVSQHAFERSVVATRVKMLRSGEKPTFLFHMVGKAVARSKSAMGRLYSEFFTVCLRTGGSASRGLLSELPSAS